MAELRNLETLEEWDGAGPALFLARVADAAQRRARLAALAARALRRAPAEVEVAHREGRAPRLLRPEGSGLHLASSSRGGLSALGAARTRIGVDVEVIEAGAPPPWNVLHPAEVAALRREADPAAAFAALWAVKEAYLKALGIGLAREPASFAVRIGPAVAIDDPGGPAARVTLLRRGEAFVAAVLLDGPA